MIIIVDDEKMGLDRTKDALLSVQPNSEIKTFNKSSEALAFIKETYIDIAFLDINMPVINGVQLAKRIKAFQPKCNIVFTTGYDTYYSSAFEIGASDYLLKPITAEKIQRALENLRTPFKLDNQKIYFQCFGNFEAFADGQPIKFKRAKTKELLAYLVIKNGASVNKNELMANLFEEDNNSYYGVLKKDLIDTLTEIGLQDIIINNWKSISIDTSKVSCDYYDFLKGIPSGLNAYMGEFMNQYSWAEYMAASIDDKLDRF